jgi:hypothetical protein
VPVSGSGDSGVEIDAACNKASAITQGAKTITFDRG